MPVFTLTKKALADLKDIARFTQSRWAREQRLHYLALLDACFQGLFRSLWVNLLHQAA
jgi:plasmid stabilization system protein ParE